MIKVRGHSFNPDLLSSDSIVIDIGGNRGEFSEAIKKNYGCHVECFEPDISAYRYISSHMSNYDKFTVHNLAVSGKSGEQDFFCALPISGGNSLLPGSREYGKDPGAHITRVNVIAMDEILVKYPIIDLVKMDCEGAELDIIKESKELKRIKQLTIEFHDFCFQYLSTKHTDECISKLESIGFKSIYSHDDPDRDYYFYQ
jgi:FkbM family methyltransferase